MTETMSDIGEFGLIRRIHELLRKEGVQGAGVTLGIGDDAASFRPRAGYELLVTCDCMIEGRHYLPVHIDPMDLGRRAMVLNISDIGAMGGQPLYALVSLGLKADTPVKYVEEMYRGFIAEMNPFNASIIGGNLTKSEHALFVDITLIGEVEKDKVMRRSNAGIGDLILITGYPGQSAAGLKLLLQHEREADDLRDHPLIRAYNRPSHRAIEGRAIAKSGYATAMIDTSDGFLGDLGHICEESDVSAELIQEKFPVSEHMHGILLPPGQDIYDMVLQDSDDYELIITCPPENADRIRSVVASLSDVPVTAVGTITGETGNIKLIRKDGSKREIIPTGWDHFKK
ncbi:MAG: thiamine-phosphate kinase [Deltaproteobacteria bacterium]|nr:thiamine-phosphate kinase [Deltaproteobacteria bacterium]